MLRTPDQGRTPEVQTNEQKFKAAFGAFPSEVSPKQIIIMLIGFYDNYKELQAVGIMEESHAGRGYFKRAAVRDWEDWIKKLGAMGDKLKAAIGAAQPFVQEDLSFLDRLRGEDNAVKSRTLTEVWEPIGLHTAITETEQNILRGNITTVLEK
jgi:hypothetical protein